MRAAVIVHERMGRWCRQLRPRLSDRPVRWFETRSPRDLEEILKGLAFPVVLIDLARQPVDGLVALSLVNQSAPAARTLVLDPEAQAGAHHPARELGATHVWTGFTPPPLVAELIALDRAGSSRDRVGRLVANHLPRDRHGPVELAFRLPG